MEKIALLFLSIYYLSVIIIFLGLICLVWFTFLFSIKIIATGIILHILFFTMKDIIVKALESEKIER